MTSEVINSVAEKFTENLINPLWRQVKYLFFYHENIGNLKNEIAELESLRARVEHLTEESRKNAENIEEDVLRWLKGVGDVEEAANLIFEDAKNVQITCFYCRCPNIKSQYSLSRKASKLSSKVQNHIAKGKFDRVGYFTSQGEMKHVSSQDLEKFESRILTLKQVLEALMDSEVSLIGICGMAGVGKTKLVTEIAKKVKMEKSFDEVAIVLVSQTSNVISIQGQIADQLGMKIAEKDSILERANRLCHRLSGDNKKIIVILDDLWADLDLAYLGIPIKDGHGKTLKVILTSRFNDVCSRMGAQRIIEVKVLEEMEAFDLFKEISGIPDVGDCDRRCISEKIAKECGGLPIAIVCIGGILRNKNEHVWKNVLTQLKKSSVATIDGKQNLAFSRIELSYQSLEDNDYKPFLLLCGLFPEDYEIPVEGLVRYTTGLPMLNDLETFNEKRDRVYAIVDHLKACYLLLACERAQLHVKLHNVVRDVCLSIASKGENVYMSRHAELTEWPQVDSFEYLTAISLSFGKMNQLPIDLECPKLRLLRLKCKEIMPNISMEGAKDLRVLDLNSFSIQSPLPLQCLLSLKTLCLDNCKLGTDIAVIVRLKKLEVLSFYESSLSGFPKEVAQVTNLKLLDLRFRNPWYHQFPSGIFLGLKKLEELYMGYYVPENAQEAKKSWVIEAESFSHLTTFQIYTSAKDILIQIFREMNTEKMERFEIKLGHEFGFEQSYDFHRRLELSNNEDGTFVLENSLALLLKKVEVLGLHDNIRSIRNLVPDLDIDGFSKLKHLRLTHSDLEYIIDATNVVPNSGLMHLQSISILESKLKGLCYGSIQPPWLCNLKTIYIEYCSEMTSLFPQSVVRCLVHLESLSINDGEMFEEVVSMEENSYDKIVELSRLTTLKLWRLPCFKGFRFGSTSQALLNQVSLPALEKLKIYKVNCPPLLVGSDMPNGSLHNMKNLSLICTKGLVCVAKADSVKLLQNLKEVTISDCNDVQVIFDLERLEITQGLLPFPQLDSLWLDDLPNLKSILRMVPNRTQLFKNLKGLYVRNCSKIIYVLSPQMAKMLVSLERLEVYFCVSIEDIIGGEEEEDKVVDCVKEFVFPKLLRICFHSLQKLRSFIPREDSKLIFHSLVDLSIIDCPQMKKVSYGKLSAPRLKQVKVKNEDNVVPDDLKDKEMV